MSIWQLLDIITPPHLRDTQFCVIETCCAGDVSTRLSIPGGLFDIVDTIVESIPEDATIGWTHDEKTFQFETRTSELSEELLLETKWLKGLDGLTSKSGRILEVELVMSPFWIVRKMGPRLKRQQDD